MRRENGTEVVFEYITTENFPKKGMIPTIDPRSSNNLSKQDKYQTIPYATHHIQTTEN